MKQSTKIIAEAVLFLAIIAGTTYYFVGQKNTQEWEGKKVSESFLEFKIGKDNIPQDVQDKYFKKFTLVKSAIEEDPNNFNTWKDLAIIKKAMGDFEGARDVWLHMNDMSPTNRVSFGNLGDLYTHFIVDYPRAIEHYRRAIQNDPKYIDFYRSVFQIYNEYWTERKDLAEGVLLEGIEKNPESSELYALLADYYADNGEKEKAIENYEKLLKLSPDNEAAKVEIEKLKED